MSELDRVIREAAEAAGFLHPEDVVRLLPRADLRLDGEGRPINLDRVMRAFKLDRPAYLAVDSSGVAHVPGEPVGDPHGLQSERGRERDGRFTPRPPSSMEMTQALRAIARGTEERTSILARLTTSPEPEAFATSDQFNEAVRAAFHGGRPTIREALADRTPSVQLNAGRLPAHNEED